ncbi:zinc finger protein 106 [Nephila pilipes]|uniref:Zinc finger protein 106 n=1 Tax=Nephila pilipes TaxID=299642 RepID=A0A8X6M6D9_NEPPI|nr:zinc finger protein 106 [Nephila pilipes]
MSSELNSPRLRSNVQVKKSKSKDAAPSENFSCNICNVKNSSMKSLETHEKGKKHEKQLRKLKEITEKNNKSSASPSNNISESNQLPSFIPLEKKHDMSNEKRNHSHNFRNNHFKLPNDSYSHCREPCPYNNRYFNYKDNETRKRNHDQPTQNNQNGRHFLFNERRNRFNHSFSQSNHLEKAQYQVRYNEQRETLDPNNKQDFSENIQPPDDSRSFENNSSNNEAFKEINKVTIDEQISSKEKSFNRKGSRVLSFSKIAAEMAHDVIVEKEDSGNEKQPEKSKVLTENMTGKRIAHWINPSNHKDKAEVRRLVTEFSKSKKKENLIKLKLQTDQNDKALIQNSSLQNTPEKTNEGLLSLPVASEIAEKGNLSNSIEIQPCTDAPLINSSKTKKRLRSKSLTDISSDSIQSSSGNFKNCNEIVKRTKTPRRSSAKNSDSCFKVYELSTDLKRKNSIEQSCTSKRHKCSSVDCFEQCIDSVVNSKDTFVHLDVPKPMETAATTVQAIYSCYPNENEAVYIKKESVETSDIDDNILSSLNINELIQKQNEEIADSSVTATMSPVESLINLFATGNITVKREFDDPLIDAIRSIDPAVLNKVCDGQLTNTYSSQEAVPEPTGSCTTDSPTIIENVSLLDNNMPFLTGSLKHILSELQNISAEEEKVKKSLQNADEKIQHYQALLDEWKTKKIKFQSEEEILRNKRNTFVNSMNDLVTQQSIKTCSTESPKLLDVPCAEQPTADVPKNNCNLSTNKNTLNSERLPVENCTSQSYKEVSKIVKNEVEDNIICIDDEITILPVQEDEVPVIDLDQSDSFDDGDGTDDISELNSSIDSIIANCNILKDLNAHNGAINALQVYEDYIYTCSNDKTARRFSLKDPTQTAVYNHIEKDVNQICVVKINNQIVLFTSTSPSNAITVFNAQEVLKLKVFNFPCNIANMCRGKGKIYVGLRVGWIVTCDLKEQKDLVNISEPIRSINSMYQGGLNLLIVLSTKGHVSIRDADRNGLLIRYVKALAHVPLFMAINNDYVYLSSAGFLSVLDISTGSFIKKYELPAAYTSLTVHKDHIFTTSFSGFVRCYSKSEIHNVQAYYGAGKKALTCICVHDDWVFTGNRSGKISVFKFDPETSLPCQFGKCKMVFSQVEDLTYHVLESEDHNLPKAGKMCPWRKCNVKIQTDWNQEALCNHIKAHIAGSFFQYHKPLYNLTY